VCNVPRYPSSRVTFSALCNCLVAPGKAKSQAGHGPTTRCAAQEEHPLLPQPGRPRYTTPPPPPPTNKGADGTTPGQAEQVSLLLGVCLSYVQRAVKVQVDQRVTFFALCNCLVAPGKGSRRRDTVPRHVASHKRNTPTSTQGTAVPPLPPSHCPLTRARTGPLPDRQSK
jgi:hypothetical protein